MTDIIIGRLLDEAEKAQRKGHLVLSEVCRDASDQLGLITEERDRLRCRWMRVLQEENSCEPTGTPCKSERCGCLAEMELLIKAGTGHE
jgi:hypothetical protein